MSAAFDTFTVSNIGARACRPVRAPLCAAAVLAAVIWFLPAGAADAASGSLFERLKGQSPTAAAELSRPAQTLPVPKDPRPFRQTKRVKCNADGICTFLLQKVGKKKQLELQNISCYTTATTSGAILTTSADVSQLLTSIVAVIPTINDTAAATNGAGPYFFKGGDQVIILMSGVPGEIGVCSIYGTIAKKG